MLLNFQPDTSPSSDRFSHGYYGKCALYHSLLTPFNPNLLEPARCLGGSAMYFPKNPLRTIVRREISTFRSDWGSTHTVYHEVLSCGHPYSLAPLSAEDFSAKRRRCHVCGAMPVIQISDPECPEYGAADCCGKCAECQRKRFLISWAMREIRKRGLDNKLSAQRETGGDSPACTHKQSPPVPHRKKGAA